MKSVRVDRATLLKTYFEVLQYGIPGAHLFLQNEIQPVNASVSYYLYTRRSECMFSKTIVLSTRRHPAHPVSEIEHGEKVHCKWSMDSRAMDSVSTGQGFKPRLRSSFFFFLFVWVLLMV